MKILMVTPYFYPKIGGLENYALNMALGFQKRGNEVIIITTNHKDKETIFEDMKGLHIIRLPILFKFSNTPINPFWYFQIRKIIKREKPDIINVHSPVPGIADITLLAARKIPTAITYHAATLKKSGSPLFNIVASIFEKIQNFSFGRASIILPVSAYVKESLPKKFQQKMHVVENSIDLKQGDRTTAKRYDNRFIFIGNLDRSHSWKGLSAIIEAMAIVIKGNNDTELIVLGDGDMRQDYESLSISLKIQNNVKFLGSVTGRKKFDLISSSTAIIAYPESPNDAFPTVFLEAWACKTAVISSKIGPISDVLQYGKFGYLAEANNPKRLAEVIAQTTKDKKTRKSIVNTAYNYARLHYTWDITCEKALSIFNRMRYKNVLLIHNIVAPYRLPIFESINAKVNLKVLFCKSITKDRVWKFDLSKFSFSYQILKGKAFGPLILNPLALIRVARTKFDVLVVNNDPDVASVAIPSILIAKIKKAKIIDWSEVTDNDIQTFRSLKGAKSPLKAVLLSYIEILVRFYRRAVINSSRHHIAFSKGAVTYLQSEGVYKDDIIRTRLLMPIDNLPAANPKTYTKRNGKRILYVGYLNERKGLDTLINSFKKIPYEDASLVIAGTGESEQKLRNIAKGDRRIKFVGYVDGINKANLYASCDIFVLPTLKDVWGLVIDEAIYYGLAVVCSDAAEASELVNRESGYIFPASDEIKLTKILYKLLNDGIKVKSMQLYNRSRTHVSDPNQMAKNIVKAIELKA